MKSKILAVAVFILVTAGSMAQNSQVLYFMNLPQNHFLNPALRQTNSIYVGLPGLTGVNVNITNNFLSFSDIFTKGIEISKENLAFVRSDFNTDDFLGKIKDLNYIEPRASVQLLGLGLTLKNGFYVFLDITDNADVNLILPRDYFRLAFLGNEEFAGQTFDLSSTRLDFKYYRELGIGASKQVNQKFRFGGKARVLFGIAAGSFQNYDLKLTVNNDFTNTLQANTALDFSGPVHVVKNADNGIEDFRVDDFEGNTLLNMQNVGFGIDLGAEYALMDNIILSAALTDVGFIKWKSDLTNLEAVGDIHLNGIDIKDVQEGRATIDDLANSLADSLKQAFVVAGEPKRFTTKFPVGLTLAGKYILNDKFSFGVMSYSRISSQQMRQAVTLSANVNLRNSFGASLCYTACNHDYSNIGIGLFGRASVFQFYFLVDRIPLSWKKTGVAGDTYTLPANWNTLHTRLGMNLVFGNRENSRR
jgi:hypothetical protein